MIEATVVILAVEWNTHSIMSGEVQKKTSPLGFVSSPNLHWKKLAPGAQKRKGRG